MAAGFFERDAVSLAFSVLVSSRLIVLRLRVTLPFLSPSFFAALDSCPSSPLFLRWVCCGLETGRSARRRWRLLRGGILRPMTTDVLTATMNPKSDNSSEVELPHTYTDNQQQYLQLRLPFPLSRVSTIFSISLHQGSNYAHQQDQRDKLRVQGFEPPQPPLVGIDVGELGELFHQGMLLEIFNFPPGAATATATASDLLDNQIECSYHLSRLSQAATATANE
ncbi:hypothetical protein NE237_024684 [Protea cynaroides]|uniref:Uncharacterized protein n=1 Tax=Protea cynaroides TaxID=273540 RepID=A0A9Q0K110_9MAGN|nr:hypothetical protein NE237_024684 [Protea cynaroides]